MPLFSILLATRDRPALFGEALASVLAQGFDDCELIVVDDGSADAHRPAYDAALAAARASVGDRLKVDRLPRRPNGHGQSYSLNVAARAASGDWLAILDDDDSWTDRDHLARAARALRSDPAPDVYMANQSAFAQDVALEADLWLAPLGPLLSRSGRPADADGGWRVTLDDLVDIDGFCHLNCLVVRRTLWAAVEGMDEGIRWECDRDLFIRLIDAAGAMIFNPAFVARHNVPDPSKAANMTTAMPMLAKRLHQLRVVDKAALFARDPRLRAHGRQHRGYVLKKIALELAGAGEWASAAHYARAALGAGPGLKWLGATTWISGRGLLSRR